MVLREEIIEIEYCPEDENGKKQTKQKKKLRLKKVCYQDEQNRYFEFITNSMESTAEEVAFLYKKRWGIETPVQENETELPTSLLLRGERKCHPYASLVYANCPTY